MSYRYMRSLLFFDLPTLTDKDRRVYRKFVKEIKKIGFYMIQESVYVKLSIDNQQVQTTMNNLKKLIPDNGSIMVLNITEKQFSQMEILLGENKTDVVTSDERVVIL